MVHKTIWCTTKRFHFMHYILSFIFCIKVENSPWDHIYTIGMSSLTSHVFPVWLSPASTLETTFDSTVTTEINGRALLALSSRPASALPWRLGSSSPRLQAGDAPSSGNTFVQHGSGCGRHTNRHQTCTHNGVLCGLDLSEKVEELEGVTMETAGYMSDGDVLGKSMKMDTVTSGWVWFDGVFAEFSNIDKSALMIFDHTEITVSAWPFKRVAFVSSTKKIGGG